MSDRDEPYRGWDDGSTVRHDPEDWREHTTPGIAPVGGARGYPPGGYPSAGYGPGGYPAGGYPPGAGVGPVTAPDYSGRPVAIRRPDAVAALLLLLAGIAAGVSLLLHWVRGNPVTGWGLMRRAFSDLVQIGPGELFRSGLWQPVAVVLAGVLLFLLSLAMFVPARSHRFLGGLALLVALLGGAGVLVALSGTNWQLGRFDIGIWFAVGVAVLGLAGALKALLTGPRLGPRVP